MSFLSSFNISGSGMTAQKYRLDIISQNIANAQVTRTAGGEAYRRKMTVLSSVKTGTFMDALNNATNSQDSGVQVAAVIEDESAWCRFMILAIRMLSLRDMSCTRMLTPLRK